MEAIVINDFSVVWISISVIVLCWAVVRINQKIDETIRNHKYNNTLDGFDGSQAPAYPQDEKKTAPFRP